MHRAKSWGGEDGVGSKPPPPGTQVHHPPSTWVSSPAGKLPCSSVFRVLLRFFFSIFFKTSLLEYNCFISLCQFLLYNKVNQLYVYLCSHIPSLLRLPPTLPIPPLQVVTKHQADFPVLCGCFPLAIYFTFDIVYMSMPLSHFIPAYLSPSPCP